MTNIDLIPRFKHNCDGCIPIAQTKLGDWYRCPYAVTGTRGSIICRFDSYPASYWSMSRDVIERHTHAGSEYMREARLIAQML